MVYVPKIVDLDLSIHSLPAAFEKMMQDLIESGQPHEDDFIFFKSIPWETAMFIDVGSNIGNSVVSITNTCGQVRIFGFEPNGMLKPYLDRAAVYNSKFSYQQFGLSDSSGSFDFYVPIVGGLIIAGESSTSLSHFSEPVTSNRLRSYSPTRDFELAKVSCELQRLDDQEYLFAAAAEASHRIVKIDTEGTELGVLRGAIDFVTKFRPTFMIENGDRPEIAGLLSEFGYSQYVFEKGQDVLADRRLRGSLNSFFVYRSLTGRWG